MGLVQNLVTSFFDLFRPRIFLFLLLPPLFFFLGCLGFFVFMWSPLSQWLVGFIQDSVFANWVSPAVVSGFFLIVIAGMVLIPLSATLTTLFLSFFLVSTLVEFVHRREFPNLQFRSSKGLGVGRIFHAVKVLVLYLIFTAVMMPVVFIFPFLGFPLHWWALAWFNSEIFGREIADEMSQGDLCINLLARSEQKRFRASAITTGLFFVPVLNLLAPTWVALVMVRVLFGYLQELELEKM